MQVEQTKVIDQLKHHNTTDTGKGIANYIQNNHTVPRESSCHSVRYQKSEENIGIFAGDSMVSRAGTYGKPGKEEEKDTLADQLQGNPEMTPEQHRNQMAVLANTTSAEDLQEMQEEGFSISDTNSRTIVTVTDKIKAVLAQAGAEVYGDELSQEQLEEITGNSAVASQIKKSLEAADLPATEDNIKDSENALAQAVSLGELNDSSIAFLIRNELTPSISNVYTAQHSGTGAASAVSTDVWNEMEDQIKQILSEAGLEPDSVHMQNSKWLIANQIPVTGDNLNYLQQLQGLSDNIAAGTGNTEYIQTVMEAITTAIAEGASPAEAMLLPGYSLREQAETALDTVNQVTDADLEYCIERGEALNLKNLQSAMQNRMQGTVRQTAMDNGESYAKEAALITARRQLEEMRLVMTAEANYSLLKKGISIDTKPLEQLVEDLKAQENRYYQNLLEGNKIPVSEENVHILADTEQLMAELKYQPAYILSFHSNEETIPQLHEEGKAMQDAFHRASQSYDTLMTAPRADMGDSIQKAFRNVDAILEDLGLDITESNQRAVRILAYNQIELTVENIQQMKAVDEEVQRAFQNLTPAVTLEMIRQNQNPLDMSISELNEVAEQIRREQDPQGEERFSKFLYKLEQNHKISEEERSGYIGIYRLIAQVEKTDGAAIGALVNQGTEVTMRNLLSAVRSGKKGRMDYSVNDGFGGVTAYPKGKRIDDQISAAFQQNCIKDAKELVSPSRLMGFSQEEILDMTPEQLKEALVQAGESPEEDAAYAKEELSRYAQILSSSEDVYSFLDHYDIPDTMLNIAAAFRMLRNPSRMFDELWKGADAETVEALKNQVLERFGEAIKNPEELAAAQEELAETAEHVMDGMIIEDRSVRLLDIRELRVTSRQFTLAAKQSHEECYMIPVQTGDQITGVSLKIIRGKKEKGFVDILFQGETLGKVTASFEAREKGISGLIATDNEETRRQLEEHLGTLAENIRKGQEEQVDLHVAMVSDLSIERYEANSRQRAEGAKEDVSRTPVQTRRLYHIAESFLQTVQEL